MARLTIAVVVVAAEAPAGANKESGMSIFAQVEIAEIVSTLVYSVIGIVVFMGTFFIVEKLTPFSIRKQLVEEKNVAIGIVMGALVLGIAMLISSSIS